MRVRTKHTSKPFCETWPFKNGSQASNIDNTSVQIESSVQHSFVDLRASRSVIDVSCRRVHIPVIPILLPGTTCWENWQLLSISLRVGQRVCHELPMIRPVIKNHEH